MLGSLDGPGPVEAWTIRNFMLFKATRSSNAGAVREAGALPNACTMIPDKPRQLCGVLNLSGSIESGLIKRHCGVLRHVGIKKRRRRQRRSESPSPAVPSSQTTQAIASRRPQSRCAIGDVSCTPIVCPAGVSESKSCSGVDSERGRRRAKEPWPLSGSDGAPCVCTLPALVTERRTH